MDEPRLRNLSGHGKILSRQTLEDLWTGPHRTLYIFLAAGILLYFALVLNKENKAQIVTVPDSAQAEREIMVVYINTNELLCGWTAPACSDGIVSSNDQGMNTISLWEDIHPTQAEICLIDTPYESLDIKTKRNPVTVPHQPLVLQYEIESCYILGILDFYTSRQNRFQLPPRIRYPRWETLREK